MGFILFCSGFTAGCAFYLFLDFWDKQAFNISVGEVFEYREKDPFKGDYSEVRVASIKDGYVLYEGKHSYTNSMSVSSFKSIYKKVKQN